MSARIMPRYRRSRCCDYDRNAIILGGTDVSRARSRGGFLKNTGLLAGLLLTPGLARATDNNVIIDKSTDFSKLKSFTIQPGKIDSSRQELNNAIVLGKITDAIRMTLLSKGLMEVTARPDVAVEFTASGVD